MLDAEEAGTILNKKSTQMLVLIHERHSYMYHFSQSGKGKPQRNVAILHLPDALHNTYDSQPN